MPEILRVSARARRGALVPKRDYALSELKLNDIEAEKLLAPTESTIAGLRDLVSKALLALAFVWVFAAHPDGRQVAGALAAVGGALARGPNRTSRRRRALALDTAAQKTSPAYVSRLRLHEAAHFLVAYLMGILPKGYTLSSLDAFEKYGALNVQAGCAFDGEFQREVRRGKIGSASLGRFSCVALAGIGMEYVAYGYAEGGVSDVRQLDGMLRALAFSQKKSDSEVRWAVLRRHHHPQEARVRRPRARRRHGARRHRGRVRAAHRGKAGRGYLKVVYRTTGDVERRRTETRHGKNDDLLFRSSLSAIPTRRVAHSSSVQATGFLAA